MYIWLYVCVCVYIHIYSCCCSVTKSCLTLQDPTDCSTPGPLSPTTSQSLPKFTSIASVMPSNHLILCRPLPLLPSIFPSIRVFSNESAVRQHRHISTLFFLTVYFGLGYNRLTYNAVIISGEEQRNLAIRIHVPILPQPPLTFRPSHIRVPYAIQ